MLLKFPHQDLPLRNLPEILQTIARAKVEP